MLTELSQKFSRLPLNNNEVGADEKFRERGPRYGLLLFVIFDYALRAIQLNILSRPKMEIKGSAARE